MVQSIIKTALAWIRQKLNSNNDNINYGRAYSMSATVVAQEDVLAIHIKSKVLTILIIKTTLR